MVRTRSYRLVALSLAAAAAGLAACEPIPFESVRSGAAAARLGIEHHSVTPVLVKGLPRGVQAYTLVSSEDVLPGSPDFVFGGSADGAALLTNPDGTFTLLTNHEDNFSVSRLTLDAAFRPVAGEYILNSDNGRWRLCSATLATLRDHGFGPTFLTVGESGVESMIHAVDPYGPPNTSRLLPALGRWNAENAVPLPKSAFPGRTVIIIGDDDSGVNGGQVALYVSDRVGDLEGGGLYVLAREDGNQREMDMVVGATYPVAFRRIENQTALTGAQIDALSGQLGAVKFGRTEDLDYRKGANAGREIYFNTTGQNNTGVNADYSRSKYGRVYRLLLSPNNPLRGTLEVILDGDDRSSPAGEFQNPDNIMVTHSYVYVQEDPNGYGDETHDARIYQYHIPTRRFQVAMELDHRRSDPKYNVGGSSRFGSWEFGAMLDISDEVHRPNTFLVALQPHTWRDDRFRGVDGGVLRQNENQGSAWIVVTGLPR